MKKRQEAGIADHKDHHHRPNHHSSSHAAKRPHIHTGQPMSRSHSASSSRSDRSGTVVSSPNMLPALSPDIQSTSRAASLHQTLIPLKTGAPAPTPAKENLIPLPSIPQSPTGNEITTPVPRMVPTVPAVSSKEGDYFSVPMRQQSGGSAPPQTPEEFSGWAGPASAKPDSSVSTPVTPGAGFMNRFKWGKAGKKHTTETPLPSAPATIAESTEVRIVNISRFYRTGN